MVIDDSDLSVGVALTVRVPHYSICVHPSQTIGAFLRVMETVHAGFVINIGYDSALSLAPSQLYLDSVLPDTNISSGITTTFLRTNVAPCACLIPCLCRFSVQQPN